MPATTPVAPGIVRPPVRPARPARPARRRTGFWLVGFVFLVTMAFSALAVITVAFWVASLALLLVGGIVAGSGAGAAFKGSVTTVLGIARPEARGEALAGLFLAGYVGLAVPVVALGLATQLLSGRVAVLGFAALLVAVVTLVSRRLLRT
jgi:MFS family permease